MAAEPLAAGREILSPVDAGPDHRQADIEFRHLRYFAVVAEELHFGRAAARLFISQPGLSQAIARLERELDVQLFYRTRGSVALTEAGGELLQRGRRLLADLQDTVGRVRTVGRGEAGLVRVGVALLAEPDWRPVRDGTAIALMAEATARAVCPADVVVVPVQPPPQYVLALAWCPGQQGAAVHRFLSYLRSYRERHAWLPEPQFVSPWHAPRPVRN